MKRKFTDDQVRKIRRLAHGRTPYSIIHAQMEAEGVSTSVSVIYKAAHGYTYRHIKNPPPAPGRQPQKGNRTASNPRDGRPRCQRCGIISPKKHCRFCIEELGEQTCPS